VSSPSHSLPVVEELTPAPAFDDAYARFAGQRHCVAFDSAMRHETLGRWSFLSADPFDFWTTPAFAADPLAGVESRLASWKCESQDHLPPFHGGAAGILSYELGASYEPTPRSQFDEFQFPALAMGLYDTVVAWDHHADKAWIVSHGFPETTPDARYDRARSRIVQFRNWFNRPAATLRRPTQTSLSLAPQFPTAASESVASNFSKEQYLAAVERAVEYIHAGDVFQVNLSQRLLHKAVDDSPTLYRRLRQRNPAPFAGYFDAGDWQVMSASPERFLKVDGGKVETRPIKGTRRRYWLPEADLFSGDELQLNEKDRAENVMIVDLLRNDLSRVCFDDSVCVERLCSVENYQFVQHLVSVIVGKLRPQYAATDLLRAAIPGGSITGAPKARAMEIIAELEPTARGPYCGALGYIGFDGNMDTNILIRTATAAGGWWQFPVGGGIVAASDPQSEYDETWHKAAGMLRALAP
jgi:para-aminobenzoate synthetase component 1